jgi:hypothetical protein
MPAYGPLPSIALFAVMHFRLFPHAATQSFIEASHRVVTCTFQGAKLLKTHRVVCRNAEAWPVGHDGVWHIARENEPLSNNGVCPVELLLVPSVRNSGTFA